MNEEEKPKLSLIERLKLQSQQQEQSGGDFMNKPAELGIQDCPNCGAGRAKRDGVTKCVYCNYEFISTKIEDGINLKSTDNSR
jgi:uncharacterized Zn finger protein (UPF0148 family)